MLARDRKQANKKLYEIGATYHDTIPLAAIFDACNGAGVYPIQEDGSPWQGFITGASGHTSFPLAHISDKRISTKVLVLSWYRMPSSRYEIVAYIS